MAAGTWENWALICTLECPRPACLVWCSWFSINLAVPRVSGHFGRGHSSLQNRGQLCIPPERVSLLCTVSGNEFVIGLPLQQRRSSNAWPMQLHVKKTCATTQTHNMVRIIKCTHRCHYRLPCRLCLFRQRLGEGNSEIKSICRCVTQFRARYILFAVWGQSPWKGMRTYQVSTHS